MGDKPGNYWDYRECAWVKSPPTADDIVVLRAPEDSVPAQERPVEAEADDPTAVGTAQ